MPNTLTFADFSFAPDPQQIEQIYRSGFRGVVADPIERMYGARLPGLYDLAPWSRGAADESDVWLAWRGMQALAGADFCASRDEAQQRGDCVGKNIKNMAHQDYANDAYFGETDWRGILCDEVIYSLRGYCSDGWWTEKAVSLCGGDPAGFLPRAKYDSPDGSDSADLSRYNPSLENRWSRCRAPDWLLRISAENPAMFRATARSLEEVDDALALGWGVGRDGGDGYSSRRNEDGVAEQSGSWSHAISVGAVIKTEAMLTKYGGKLYGLYHNWGQWNEGGKVYEQPDGSWFVRERYLERLIGSGQVHIVGQIKGYGRDYYFARRDKLKRLSND